MFQSYRNGEYIEYQFDFSTKRKITNDSKCFFVQLLPPFDLANWFKLSSNTRRKFLVKPKHLGDGLRLSKVCSDFLFESPYHHPFESWRHVSNSKCLYQITIVVSTNSNEPHSDFIIHFLWHQSANQMQCKHWFATDYLSLRVHCIIRI